MNTGISRLTWICTRLWRFVKRETSSGGIFPRRCIRCQNGKRLWTSNNRWWYRWHWWYGMIYRRRRRWRKYSIWFWESAPIMFRNSPRSISNLLTSSSWWSCSTRGRFFIAVRNYNWTVRGTKTDSTTVRSVVVIHNYNIVVRNGPPYSTANSWMAREIKSFSWNTIFIYIYVRIKLRIIVCEVDYLGVWDGSSDGQVCKYGIIDVNRHRSR